MKEELKFICDDFKLVAKRAIETRQKLIDLESDSAEYRIQYEVLDNIMKKLITYGEIIYSGILSYNNAPDTFTHINKEDVLHLQLVQDEVIAMLNENEIHLHCIHPNDRKNLL